MQAGLGLSIAALNWAKVGELYAGSSRWLIEPG